MSAGICLKNISNAGNAPADPPIHTIGNALGPVPFSLLAFALADLVFDIAFTFEGAIELMIGSCKTIHLLWFEQSTVSGWCLNRTCYRIGMAGYEFAFIVTNVRYYR